MTLGLDRPHSYELVDEQAIELPSTDPERLIGEALTRRPEVAGRRFDVEAAVKTVAAERKLRFPSVNAVASLGVIPAYAEKLGNNHYAAVGLNVSLPFLNGGLYAARRREAEYKAAASRRRLDQVEQGIARDVAVAVISAQSAAQRIALSRQLVEQASLALDLAQARYDLGLSSIVELSQAQVAHTNAEIQNANARYDYQLQRAIVAYQIGELQ
jgi:outer membrane protein